MSVAEARTYVDVEGAIREWARATVASVSGRVFFGPAKAALPQIVLQRLGGPDGEAFVQFDVWATDKAEADETAADLATAIDALERYVSGDGTVLLHGAAVESIRWLPDPESDRPRSIVDATFCASAANAGS